MINNTSIRQHLARAAYEYFNAQDFLAPTGYVNGYIQGDTRIMEDEKYEVPGIFITYPAVIFSCADFVYDTATLNASLVPLVVTLKTCVDFTSMRGHEKLETEVSDLLWDETALEEALNLAPSGYPETYRWLLISGVQNTERAFLMQNRLRETTFRVNVQAAPNAAESAIPPEQGPPI